ncbi:Alpha-aminoadipate--LysW ligase LysX [Thalassovita gelatinovora]|uniref:Alpha-aminoadipate--LysW ligase LysX n=1 Tax=Thalassovita gelatinovora TaxID=53501 RepID=A0A0P1FXZ6_THAGE|nr:GAK system ATP-grasp enzyme [Thalassovita gelatinovora]QIZ81182.1 GAK system ATP-grasp enzyme [Thalassovita gelatinovora]CUH64757.1 Alpha-aminoadipate--LysW ligase LysX [Thalassovita gelatinovora]SEP92503.1 SSU ribosomal protein S6P modification protein [Thalassovita gelatinovora]
MAEPKIGVIGIPGKWSTETLADAVEAHTGIRRVIDMGRVVLDLDTGSLMHDGEDLCSYDALIVKKISEIYSPHVLDRLELLRIAEARGVRVFSNPEAILRLIDRLACTVSLRLADIPMPRTRVTEDLSQAEAAVETFGSAVFKPLYSTKARGMCVIDRGAGAAEQIREFAAENPVMYIQEKLDLSGQDLGMVFLNGDYLCTYARVSASETWNTTIHSGGKYAAYAPAPDLIDLARRAQAPFGLSFTTVDVAMTADGPIVFEVSAFGGFRGARDGCGLDAAALLAQHVLKEVAA